MKTETKNELLNADEVLDIAPCSPVCCGVLMVKYHLSPYGLRGAILKNSSFYRCDKCKKETDRF